MSYIDSNLSKGEEIVKRAKVSWWYAIPQVLIGTFFLCLGLVWLFNNQGIFAIAAIILGLYFIVPSILLVLTTELALTNKRIVAKFGFIKRESIEVRLEKVESVNFDQGIFGRIFDFGYIFINGAGNYAPIPAIAKPLEFKKEVNDYLETLQDEKRS